MLCSRWALKSELSGDVVAGMNATNWFVADGARRSCCHFELKDGRLINNAPEPEMGLTKLINMKNSIKRAKKVRMIAEGNELANANIDLFKKL